MIIVCGAFGTLYTRLVDTLKRLAHAISDFPNRANKILEQQWGRFIDLWNWVGEPSRQQKNIMNVQSWWAER
jgi:hypothetical protein